MRINKQNLLLSAIVGAIYTTIPVIVFEIKSLNFIIFLILALLTAINSAGYYGVMLFYNTAFAKYLYLVVSFFPTWIIIYLFIDRARKKNNGNMS